MSAARRSRVDFSQFDAGQIARHLIFAVVCGALVAVAVIALVWLTDRAFDLLGAFPWLLYLLPVFALATCGLYRLLHSSLHATINTLVQAMRSDRALTLKSGFAMAIGTYLSILGGASVDRTGASVSLGATIGSRLGALFKLKTVRKYDSALADQRHEDLADEYLDDLTPLVDDDPGEVLSGDADKRIPRKDVRLRGMQSGAIACGMAAAFAAIFFAPLSGTMLVLELASFRRPVRRHILPILIAAFTAATINHFVGLGNVLPHPNTLELTWHGIGLAAVIGVACALVGRGFVEVLTGVGRATRRFSVPTEVWNVVGGTATVLLIVACGWQSFQGPGLDMISSAMKGEGGPWDFAIKALLTIVALGFWIKGGAVTPTLVTGATLGYSCTYLVGGDVSLAAVIGMIALFSAVQRCPLAAVLLGCEVFGWAGFPFYLIAVIIVNIVGRDMGLYGEGAVTAFRRLVSETRHRRNR